MKIDKIFHMFSKIFSAFLTKNTHKTTITTDRKIDQIILNNINFQLLIFELPAINGTKALNILLNLPKTISNHQCLSSHFFIYLTSVFHIQIKFQYFQKKLSQYFIHNKYQK